MNRPPIDRILEDWDAVTRTAHHPVVPPRGMEVRGGGLSGSTFAGVGLLVAAVLIAAVWIGRPGSGPTGVAGGPPSTPPSPTATALVPPSPSPTPPPSPTPNPSPTPTATPTPAPTMGPCDPAKLAARLIAWEGAAGNRIAHVELTNAARSACTMRALDRPQLVDGHGSVLIDGSDPPASALLTMTPGEVFKTLVDTANFCGPTPVPPVTVAFVLGGGGRIVATPVSSTDATVPPCNGSPGSAGEIQMHPWAR